MKMLENYAKYLFFIQTKLNGFFEKQKPYIFCKKGCSMCCKNATFPYSSIEVQYLMLGFSSLDTATQDLVRNNIQSVIDAKKNYKGNDFKYDCPFLVNDACSVYNHRGIICRSFGLLHNGTDGRMKIPFCCFDGYNYSNVVDLEKSYISLEKFNELDTDKKPLAFNTSYEFLTHSDFERGFNFSFGDKKPLIDFFIID